jgi:hypothetical protein
MKRSGRHGERKSERRVPWAEDLVLLLGCLETAKEKLISRRPWAR